MQIELDEQLAITDYKGNEQGHLSIELLPCKPDGSALAEDEDLFVEEPNELVRSSCLEVQNITMYYPLLCQLGTHVNFLLKIVHARGIPSRFTKVVTKQTVRTRNIM